MSAGIYVIGTASEEFIQSHLSRGMDRMIIHPTTELIEQYNWDYLILRSQQFQENKKVLLQRIESGYCQQILISDNFPLNSDRSIWSPITTIRSLKDYFIQQFSVENNFATPSLFTKLLETELSILEFSILYAVWQTYRKIVILSENSNEIQNFNEVSHSIHQKDSQLVFQMNQSVHQRQLDAVVIPTIPQEVDGIIKNFEHWNNPKFMPYAIMPTQPKVDLVFVYGQQPESQVIERIKQAFKANGLVNQSFRNLHFLNAGLTEEENIYSSSYIGKSKRKYVKLSPKFGYKAGPNHVFLFLIEQLHHYNYIFLMESDCQVIRRNWLHKANELCANSEPFWVKGSIYRGLSLLQVNSRYHLNGNAFYATGNEEFQEFICLEFKKYLKTLVKHDPIQAYDTAMSVYLADPENLAFTQKNYQYFTYTDFIQNYGGDPSITGGDYPNIWEIRKNHPDTFVVHGKKIRSDIFIDDTTS